MIRQIFVGGSGRSGTTLLLEALGKHPEIHSFLMEMRFIIDPDGLVNLVDALSRNYCPFQAREALYRFHKLMKIHLCRPRQRPYMNFHFPGIFGKEFYSNRFGEFFNALIDYEFEGKSYFEVNEENPEMKRKIFGARYFPDRAELIKITASFIDDLFSKAAADAGKPIWCEKTPFNVLHMGFLWELFPKAAIFHIFRDPRAIVFSLIQPSEWWAPDDVHNASLFLKSFFDRWFYLKENLDMKDKQFVEIKYEDLVKSPRAILEKVKYVLKLNKDFLDFPPMNIARLDAWKKELSSDQKRVIENVLGPVIEKLGY
jgi:omega-hydroxy-beta-dihydromenaquinone-9 sulfotransferase